ncbi:hypothetical protein ACE6H2_027876 [Prunus campanulata]
MMSNRLRRKITEARKGLVLKREKWHDVKPVEKKKSKSSSSRNPGVPNKLIQGGAPIDFKLMRLMNTYIPWKEVKYDKKQLVLQRQKWHDAIKPVEKKKSKGKGSSSSNPEPDPLLEVTEAFAQTQTNFKAVIRSFMHAGRGASLVVSRISSKCYLDLAE